MAFSSISFPQGFPSALPSQPSSLRSEGILDPDLDLRSKKRIIKSTGLVSRRWIPWHCNAIAILGPQAYIDIADDAKGGQEPETLFSWLLKEAMEDNG